MLLEEHCEGCARLVEFCRNTGTQLPQFSCTSGTTVPAKPLECSHSVLLYQYSLQSVLEVLFCTDIASQMLLQYFSIPAQPAQCYTNSFKPAQPPQFAYNTRLYEHSRSSSSVVFNCTNTAFHWGSTVGFLLIQCSSGVVRHPRDIQVWVATRFCRVLIFASS